MPAVLCEHRHECFLTRQVHLAQLQNGLVLGAAAGAAHLLYESFVEFERSQYTIFGGDRRLLDDVGGHW